VPRDVESPRLPGHISDNRVEVGSFLLIRHQAESMDGRAVLGQGGVGRPGGEGNRPPYPPACAEAETRRRRGVSICGRAPE
jgi:hypothetical protein